MQSPTPKCFVLSLLITSFLIINSIHLAFSKDLCNPSDKTILLGIKSQLNNASVFTTWDPNTDCCSAWSGIQCNTHGRVTMLAVSDADDVVGQIPSSVVNLPFLNFFTFSVFSHVSGFIPPILSKLNLNHLDFSLNNLSGPIPDFIAQFKSLDTLDLSSNSFSGPIPASLGRLTKLKSANLGANKLSGPIPASLGQIKSLDQLYLYENLLSGPLPGSLASLPNLNELDIRQNKLTGSIPPTFGLFKSPALNLDLSFNSITGSIPKAFGNANITALDLSNNMFTGDASILFGRKKTAMNTISLSNNQFKFDFSNVGLSPRLKNLDISHNMIYGSLPKELGQLPLQTLDVSFNQLCGQIPTGRRLKQFGATKFSSNNCLCGVPLPVCN